MLLECEKVLLRLLRILRYRLALIKDAREFAELLWRILTKRKQFDLPLVPLPIVLASKLGLHAFAKGR